MQLVHALVDPLQYGFMQRSLIIAILVGLIGAFEFFGVPLCCALELQPLASRSIHDD